MSTVVPLVVPEDFSKELKKVLGWEPDLVRVDTSLASVISEVNIVKTQLEEFVNDVRALSEE